MYNIGDLIIYGSTGVCRVCGITSPGFRGAEKDKRYYELKPLYQTCTIFAPMDNPKVYMRPIISADEADRLIDSMPSIQAEAYHNRVLRQLVDHYEERISTHECTDLIELTLSIYAKKRDMQLQNKKFGQIDERYMRKAEELLFGELAAALEISREDVQKRVAETLNAADSQFMSIISK